MTEPAPAPAPMSDPTAARLEASGATLPPVTARFIAVYVFAQIAAWTGILTPVVVTIALQVAAIADETSRASELGIVLAVGAFAAMIAAPIWGAISDRTTWSFGRRRTWMVVGALLLLIGLTTMALAPNMLVLGIGWFVCQFGSNANQAALNAVMPDAVPDHQRGKVSGFLGLTATVAILIGTFITQFTTGDPIAMFLVPWLMIPVGVTLLCITFEDRPADRAQLPPFSIGQLARTFWVNPVKHPDFGWAFLSRFLVFLGTAFLQTYQVYFLTDHLDVGGDEIASFVFFSTVISSVITVAVSVLGGWLSDVFKRRKPFVWAAAIIAGVGLITIGTSSTFEQFLVGAAITSLGSGLYYAIDIALAVAVLPNPDDAAKDMGVFQIANSAPQSLAPAIAPIFLAIGATSTGNYPAVFIAATVFAVLGAFAVLPIRKTR